MMIGTPTASSLWPAYLLTVFSVVAGFAVYDILYRRVPDRALAFFMPFAALAPLLKVCLAGDGGQLWPTVAEALAGALLGFASLWLLPWQRVELGLEEAILNSVGYLG